MFLLIKSVWKYLIMVIGYEYDYENIVMLMKILYDYENIDKCNVLHLIYEKIFLLNEILMAIFLS